MPDSLKNSLFAGNSPGDGCDQHCVASQLQAYDLVRIMARFRTGFRDHSQSESARSFGHAVLFPWLSPRGEGRFDHGGRLDRGRNSVMSQTRAPWHAAKAPT